MHQPHRTRRRAQDGQLLGRLKGRDFIKAYMNITRDELRAAVEEAHKRGLKVTGHL